jgi:hypothetical protein
LFASFLVPIGRARGIPRVEIEIAGSDGGRGRIRTCDPALIKRML